MATAGVTADQVDRWCDAVGLARRAIAKAVSRQEKEELLEDLGELEKELREVWIDLVRGETR